MLVILDGKLVVGLYEHKATRASACRIHSVGSDDGQQTETSRGGSLPPRVHRSKKERKLSSNPNKRNRFPLILSAVNLGWC